MSIISPEDFALNAIGVPLGMEQFQHRLVKMQDSLAKMVRERDAEIRREVLADELGDGRMQRDADGNPSDELPGTRVFARYCEKCTTSFFPGPFEKKATCPRCFSVVG